MDLRRGWMRLVLVLLMSLIHVVTADLALQTCSLDERRLVVNPDADVFVFSTIPFRFPGDQGYGCGAMYEGLGAIEFVEAVKFSLNLLNQDTGTIDGRAVTSSYIPGVKMGMILYDSCTTGALAQAAVLETMPHLQSSPQSCTRNTSHAIIGMIGAASSSFSIPIASLLGKHGIPQISPFATASSLSDKSLYPTFMRTIPPDSFQVKVILALLKALEWTNFGIIYQDDAWGQEMKVSLLELADENNLCVSKTFGLPVYDLNSPKYQQIGEAFVESGVSAVVAIIGHVRLSTLLSSISDVPGIGQLHFIFPESVRAEQHLFSEYHILKGSLLVAPKIDQIPEFNNHWEDLDPSLPVPGNPWFQEWYMTRNKCKFPGFDYDPFQTFADCGDQTEEYKQGPYMEPALLAVYSFARAFREARSDMCGSVDGMCSPLLELEPNEFLEGYIKNLDFTFGEGERLASLADSARPGGARRTRFDNNGNIIDNIFEITSYNDRHGDFEFEVVGSFDTGSGSFNFNPSDVIFYNEARDARQDSPPTSRCPESGCSECVSLRSPAEIQNAYIDGNVYLAGIFDVHFPSGDALTCDGLNPVGMQMLEAFLYAVGYVNGNHDLNIKLGAVGIDQCGNGNIASSLITDIHRGVINLKDTSGVNVNPGDILSYIATHTSSVDAVLQELDLSLLSYERDLRQDRESENNLLTSMAITAEQHSLALLAVLQRLGWEHAHLVYGASMSSVEVSTTLEEVASKKGVCFISVHKLGGNNENEVVNRIMSLDESQVVVLIGNSKEQMSFFSGLETTGSAGHVTVLSGLGLPSDLPEDIREAVKGTISLRIQNNNATGFYAYLNGIDVLSVSSNPWFAKWYESMFNCYINEAAKGAYTEQCENAKIPSSDSYHQNADSILIINSVYAFANGLHKTLQHYCGDAYTDLCSSFSEAQDKQLSLVQNIQEAEFTSDDGNQFKFIDGQPSWNVDILSFNGESFTMVGNYYTADNGEKVILDTNNLEYATASNPRVSCSGECSECFHLYKLTDYISTPGDFIIGAVQDIHMSGQMPYTCGDVRRSQSYQFVEAVQYAIAMVNSGRAPVRLNNVQLGSLIVDGCNSALKASQIVSSIHSGSEQIQLDLDNVVAWILRGSKSAVEVGDIVGRLGLLEVGVATTDSAVQNRKRLPTFFNTLNTDDIMYAGMMELFQQLGWAYVQVVYKGNDWGRQSKMTFEQWANDKGICILRTFELGDGVSYNNLINSLQGSPTEAVVVFGDQADIRGLVEARKIVPSASGITFFAFDIWPNRNDMDSLGNAAAGLITLRIGSPVVEEFDTYLSSKYPVNGASQWFFDYYEEIFQCDITGFKYQRPCLNTDTVALTHASHYAQDFLLINNINAVYAITDALDKLLKDICGDSYSGICDNFYTYQGSSVRDKLIEKMEDVSFIDPAGDEFSFENRERKTSYDILKLDISGDTIRIGHYENGILNISTANLEEINNNVNIDCGSQCLLCEGGEDEEDQIDDEDAVYSPGNIIIAGIFDVHNQGAGPLSCGSINVNQGYQLKAAFDYAIQSVNDGTGMFKNKLANITLGSLILDSCKSSDRAASLVANIQSGNLQFSDEMTATDIVAYIGAYDNDASKKTADILTEFSKTQISYGSTNSDLNNRDKYPYFLRTVPSDTKQANAMISLLRKLKVDYVQVVHSRGTYGEGAAASFIEAAEQKGICIAQTIMFQSGQSLETVANNIIYKMLEKQDAKVVMIFLDVDHIGHFLTSLQSKATDVFSLIASDSWARRTDVINGVGDAAEKTVTFGVETSDIVQFDEYLVRKDAGKGHEQGWFDEFYEQVLTCSFKEGSSNPCDPDTAVITDSSYYKQDDYVIYTINAVYAVAEGMHVALKEHCGDDYKGICPQFVNNVHDITEYIKSATFKDMTGQTFDFNANGESTRGYHIYKIEELSYNNVGSYGDSDQLKITSDIEVKVSSCDALQSCSECPEIEYKRTRLTETPSPSEINNMAVFFNIHHPAKDNPYKCGVMDYRYGFQNYLSYYYIMDEMRSEGADVGGMAIDTCGNAGQVSSDLFAILGGNQPCGASGSIPPSSLTVYMAMGNENSMMATSLLAPLNITTVSPSATAVQLSNVDYFLRTVNSDEDFATAVVFILKAMGWTDIAAIYTDNSYGNSAVDAFVRVSKRNNGACVRYKAKLTEDAIVQDTKVMLDDIVDLPGVNVVVLLTTGDHANLIMRGIRDFNLQGKLFFIGNDHWSNSLQVVDGLEDYAKGSITLQADLPIPSEFVSFFTELTVAHHGGVPDDWFEEFWQHALKCSLENATIVQPYDKVCKTTDRLSENHLNQQAYLSNTILATQMIARAQEEVQACDTNQENCSIYAILADMMWPLSESNQFRFNSNGDGNINYTILNFQEDDQSYEYIKVGTYKGGEFSLKTDEVYFYDSEGKKIQQVNSLCPTGVSCDCEEGTGPTTDGPVKPTAEETGDRDIDIISHFDETSGIIILVFTCLGIFITIVFFIYFLVMYPIKGGTTSLGFLLLFGVLCVYTINFAFILEPRHAVCGVRRLGLGFVHAICFASMLVKVLNTWRIGYLHDVPFTAPTYVRLSHPLSLVLIALFLAMVQALIAAEWLILEHPEHGYVQDTVVPLCTPVSTYNQDLVISCVYVMVLIFLTFIFSAVTFFSKENNYESRWILLTTCLIIFVWIAWCILYIELDVNAWQLDWVVLIANLVIATLILLLIFVRKVVLLMRFKDDEEEEHHSRISVHNMSFVKDDGSLGNNNPAYAASNGSGLSPKESGSRVGYVYGTLPRYDEVTL